MTLRDDIVAYSMKHICNGLSKKRLLIRVPVIVVEQINPTHKWLDLFDSAFYDSNDTSDYVYLRLFPEYDVENDHLGEKGLKNTFSSAAVFVPANTRRGFKAIVKDRRSFILDLIRRLVDISESTAYNRYSPIKVVDFCHPELASDPNTLVNAGELATVRWGAIALDANLPSLVRIGNDDCLKKDWGFTFKEAFLRLN